MERVVVLGRGGAGKTTLSRELGHITGLPVVELDTEFWSDEATPMPAEEWTATQRRLTEGDRWILDGDLGPYDAPAARLERADTVIIVDLSLLRSAWRARRRGRERADFWWWVLTWRLRWRSREVALATVVAPDADLVTLHTPSQVRRFLGEVAAAHP